MELSVIADLLGSIGGCVLAICTIPQIILMWKQKSASDVSLVFVCMYFSGVVMSPVYMIMIEAWAGAVPLIVETAFGFLMIGLKLHFDRHQRILLMVESSTSKFSNLPADPETQQRTLLGDQVPQPQFCDLPTVLDSQLNHDGDSFIPGNHSIHTKTIENAVLDHFAKLWDASPQSWWGYALTIGSTEGILCGLLSARDYLKGQLLISEPKLFGAISKEKHGRNELKPVAFFSDDSHYSVGKACAILGLTTFGKAGEKWYPNQNTLSSTWPSRVPSNPDGSINVPILLSYVEFFASRGHPIIVVLNLGSTFKGNYDDIDACTSGIVSICSKYGLDKRTLQFENGVSVRKGYWIHIDGGVGAAGYFPYLKKTLENGYQTPCFTFSNPAVSSISFSGNKWITTPWPTGVYMSRTLLRVSSAGYVTEDIESSEATLTQCSNRLTPLLLSHQIEYTTEQLEIEHVMYFFGLIDWFVGQLKELEIALGNSLWIQRSHLSLTVRFRKLCPELIANYSSIECEKEQGWDVTANTVATIDVSFIYITKYTKKEMLERLIQDCCSLGNQAFHPQSGLALHLE
jgi:histidine decarboxylase